MRRASLVLTIFWALCWTPIIWAKDTINGPANQGIEISTDLPTSQHLKNLGGSDGAGLCVFTSITHSARWQNVLVLQDFRDWMTHFPGGGYPEKVDKMIAKKCQEAHCPAPDYVQVETFDPELLMLALRTGRMPAITWGTDDRYNNQPIAHMVSLVHLDKQWGCILDNNFPGTYLWCPREIFDKRHGKGGAWAVILLNPGPPPPPWNQAPRAKIIGDAPKPVDWDKPSKDYPTNNFGVDQEKIGRSNFPPYQINGVGCNRVEIMDRLKNFEDDSLKFWVTIIGGSDQDRAHWLEILAKEPWAREARISAFPASHWVVETGGFAVQADRVTVYVQEPDGRVRWRVDTEAGINQGLESLRKPKPNYDPQKDPKPGQGQGLKPLLDLLSRLTLEQWAIVILVVLVLWQTWKRGK